MWSGRFGTIRATTLRIDLQDDARPQFQYPYRTGLKGRKIVAVQMEKKRKAQIIEPVPPNQSEWASPIVLVAKKDGSVRFCVDYRKLNAVTKRDSYPIPRMDDCLDSLGEAVVFTTLDANSGYWQIPLAEDATALTTFTTHEGLFIFNRMPFGLKNAPATFQRVMDIILSRVKWKFALVYLDDFIIFSGTVKEHFCHVKKVLTIPQDAGVTLTLRKCAFFQASLDYLDQVVFPGKLKVATLTTNAILQAKPPRTHKELRSFVGLCNVYQRFVQVFSKISAPLNAMLKKGTPSEFEALTDYQYEAFQTVKDQLLNPPILALPKPNRPFVLETDASDV
ncbi:unnamed protein product [Agarophyton chilense]